MRRGTCGAALALALIAAVSLLAGPANGNAAPRAGAQAATCPVSLDGLNLTQATIAQLRAALDSGQISSLQLVDAYLARIKALNASGPQLRAVITTKYARSQALAADQARAAA